MPTNNPLRLSGYIIRHCKYNERCCSNAGNHHCMFHTQHECNKKYSNRCVQTLKNINAPVRRKLWIYFHLIFTLFGLFNAEEITQWFLTFYKQKTLYHYSRGFSLFGMKRGFKNLFSFSSYFSISTSSVLSSEIYSVTSPESGSFVIASVDEAVSSLFSDASTLELSILFSASDFKEA